MPEKKEEESFCEIWEKEKAEDEEENSFLPKTSLLEGFTEGRHPAGFQYKKIGAFKEKIKFLMEQMETGNKNGERFVRGGIKDDFGVDDSIIDGAIEGIEKYRLQKQSSGGEKR